jgi:hypothetical protein
MGEGSLSNPAAIICPFVLFPQVIESIPLASLPASSKVGENRYIPEKFTRLLPKS